MVLEYINMGLSNTREVTLFLSFRLKMLSEYCIQLQCPQNAVSSVQAKLHIAQKPVGRIAKGLKKCFLARGSKDQCIHFIKWEFVGLR